LPQSAANKEVLWTSDNPEVATVDNGLVTARAIGVAEITVTTVDGNKTAKCKVECSLAMILVEGGTFTMGCTDGECWSDGREEPAHQVTLSSYKIGKYPVTQKEWFAVMGTNPGYFEGDDLPVERVSWYDAQEFIVKLNELTGNKYRLATEAEWEYAARGGKLSKGYKYSGSNDIDEVAWYGGNSDYTTHPVGTKKPNELGIYDMSGNVWEWCNDWYSAYTDESQTNPQGPVEGSNRVYRGGGWDGDAQNCRVSYRYGDNPSFLYYSLGFRVAVSL
jgi:formylglycine-generating enzyme required for sulfatase activity